jgi:hypothetical protein
MLLAKGGSGSVNPIRLREVVADASARLKAGEQPGDVPCPKCGEYRYLSVEGEKYPLAACSCCGFTWMLP